MKKKDPHSVTGWRRLWFTLKGKSLAYYKKEREEVDEIDLRKVVELKGAESTSTPDLCIIQIITEDKYVDVGVVSAGLTLWAIARASLLLIIESCIINGS